MRIKIYNIDVVDCSSCYNSIFPNPENKDILLEILLKICESDVVAAIGKFQFYLNDVELQSPNIHGTEYDKEEDSRYELATGRYSQHNKFKGLLVEIKEDAKKRIKLKGPTRFFDCKTSHYIKPGLDGIKKCINYMKFLYNNKKDNLPEYLKDNSLRQFGFSVGVIWGMNAEGRKSEDGSYYNIDDYYDFLEGRCDITGCEFEFGNFGGDSYEIYTSEFYLNHLNRITEILDDIAPGKYNAGPDEYYKMLKAGILKKEGRKLIPPNLENLEDLIYKNDMGLLDIDIDAEIDSKDDKEISKKEKKDDLKENDIKK